jgi:hypothetical protein
MLAPGLRERPVIGPSRAPCRWRWLLAWPGLNGLLWP